MGNYCTTNNCCSDGKEEVAEFNMDVSQNHITRSESISESKSSEFKIKH
jgi:hypothetical protein